MQAMSPQTPLLARQQHQHSQNRPYGCGRGDLDVEGPCGGRALPASMARHAGAYSSVSTYSYFESNL